MDYIIVIPARLQSSRLPQKMLRNLCGQPLIERTWHSAQKSAAQRVIIATDSPAIYDHMHTLGAEVVMTSNTHESGTDRLSEVSKILQLSDDQVVVNWQGDEPFLPADFIELVAETLIKNPSAAMSTLATPLYDWVEIYDPNAVKVVLNEADEALYFSRAPIPYQRNNMSTTGIIEGETPYLRHIGLYAYRASFLNQYPHLVPSQLETLEKLEQLRALANNFTISVAISLKTPPPGIDTEQDLITAEKWIQNQ